MNICGQKHFIEKINKLASADKFPRFSIIVGDTGFGKKLLCDFSAQAIGANFVPCDIKIDDVREVISNSYAVASKTLYMFADIDGMSLNAKNALLKVTEEPPNDSYFMMTVKDINNVLPTLISRATVFQLDPYSLADIREFMAEKKYEFSEEEKHIVESICVCPNDVSVCKEADITNIYNLAGSFISYIGQANLGNELKITTLLSTKQDDGKINPVLFLRCVMTRCNELNLESNSGDDHDKYLVLLKLTSQYLKDLTTKGSNKQLLLDNWIIDCHLNTAGGQL